MREKINHAKHKDSRSFPTLSPTTGNAVVFCFVFIFSLYMGFMCMCRVLAPVCLYVWTLQSSPGGCFSGALCFVDAGALYWPGTQCLCQAGYSVSLSLALQFFNLSSEDIYACRQALHQPSQFFTNSPSYPVLQIVLLYPQFTEYLRKHRNLVFCLCHLFVHCTFLPVK